MTLVGATPKRAYGNASLTNAKATVLDTTNIGGNLTVTASAGTSLTQIGVLTVRWHLGVHHLAANATIALADGATCWPGAVSLNTNGAAGNASLTNALAGGLVLGTSTVGSMFTAVSTLGNLTQNQRARR